ncbi:MAG: hypothetical protein GY719_38300 [bacterium]|nr:hypothetical protein [bacterium]
MPQYTRRAQVLFTEEQYHELTTLARESGQALGALLRDAAVEVYLRQRRQRQKAKAVHRLLALKQTEPPADYHEWEQRYLDERSTPLG